MTAGAWTAEEVIGVLGAGTARKFFAISPMPGETGGDPDARKVMVGVRSAVRDGVYMGAWEMWFHDEHTSTPWCEVSCASDSWAAFWASDFDGVLQAVADRKQTPPTFDTVLSLLAEFGFENITAGPVPEQADQWSESDRARVAAILSSLPGCPVEDDDCAQCAKDRDAAIREILAFAHQVKEGQHA